MHLHILVSGCHMMRLALLGLQGRKVMELKGASYSVSSKEIVRCA